MPSWEHSDLFKVIFIVDTLTCLIMALCLCCCSYSYICLLYHPKSQMGSQWTLVFLNKIYLEKGGGHMNLKTI